MDKQMRVDSEVVADASNNPGNDGLISLSLSLINLNPAQ